MIKKNIIKKWLHKCTSVILPIAALLLINSCASEYKIVSSPSPLLEEMQREQPYVIGCGDRLRISVWKDDSLTTETVVRPDGNISFPLIGDIQAKGLTIEDLKTGLNKFLKEYINEPNVSVSVTDIQSMKIYVLGEVNRPGSIDLISYTDALQAIALAGGFTIYAKKDQVQILRGEGDHRIKIKFNYNQVVQGRNLNQNIPLKPGDVIIVP